MLMSLFVQLWLMWGAQPRCRLWSLRRVRMHSGTSDWLKSIVHPYVFQVNKHAFSRTWRHGRKRDKRRPVWYSGTNAFVETAASIFAARKAMVLAWGRGSGTVTPQQMQLFTLSAYFCPEDGAADSSNALVPTYQNARRHVPVVEQSLNPKHQTQC